MTPIFFAWTRSFWATVAGIGIAIFGAPPEVLDGAGQAWAWLASFWGSDVTAQAAGAQIQRIAPLMLWIFAMHQRSGSARPYTMRASRETLT
jgi:hypothetical protein